MRQNIHISVLHWCVVSPVDDARDTMTCAMATRRGSATAIGIIHFTTTTDLAVCPSATSRNVESQTVSAGRSYVTSPRSDALLGLGTQAAAAGVQGGRRGSLRLRCEWINRAPIVYSTLPR